MNRPFLRTLSAISTMLVLTQTPAFAQQGGEANLQTGASYSTLRGGLAFIGLNADDLLGSGLDLSLGFQAGEDGQALNANVAKTYPLGTTAFGQDTFVRATLSARASDWTSQTYSLESYAGNLTVGASTVSGLQYTSRLFWQQDTLDDFDGNISPLAAIPLDKSTALGLGAGLQYSTFSGQGPMATGLLARANVAVATSAGDREWASSEIGVQYNAALPMGMILSFKGEAGQIEGRNGDTVNIVDRAFLGNPMPRGFAFSGLGPRDFVVGSVDTPLGGNTFATTATELRIATPNPNVVVAAFADTGALWDLDVVDGGASGKIDDGYFLRTSVGLSVYWDTPIGLMQLNVAKPIDKLETDQEERVSLNLNFQF